MRLTLIIIALGGLLLAQNQPVKCGGMVRIGEGIQMAPATYARPIMQAVFISDDGEFAIHYDTTGTDSVIEASSRPDGVPDWVVSVAEAYSFSRNKLLAMGYDAPAADDDSIYDVYLRDDLGSGTYGLTYSDGFDAFGREISYIEMDNDFAYDENYYTYGLPAARVTAAHEYFHAVQFSYGGIRSSTSWFYELISTWFEDIAYPEINDWVPWFGTFASTPKRQLSQSNGYSLAIFGHYIDYVFDDGNRTIRQLVEKSGLSGYDPVQALNDVLGPIGYQLTTFWPEFIAALYYNDKGAEYHFYADQSDLATVDFGDALILGESPTHTFQGLSEGAARFQIFQVDSPTNLIVSVEDAPMDWNLQIISENGIVITQERITASTWYGSGYTSLSKLLFIVGGDQDSVRIALTPKDTLESIEFVLEPIAPNPVYGGRNFERGLLLTYSLNKALPTGVHHISIYNLLGVEIYHRKIIRVVGEGSHSLRLPNVPRGDWPSGVYILQLRLGDMRILNQPFTIIK